MYKFVAKSQSKRNFFDDSDSEDSSSDGELSSLGGSPSSLKGSTHEVLSPNGIYFQEDTKIPIQDEIPLQSLEPSTETSPNPRKRRSDTFAQDLPIEPKPKKIQVSSPDKVSSQHDPYANLTFATQRTSSQVKEEEDKQTSRVVTEYTDAIISLFGALPPEDGSITDRLEMALELASEEKNKYAKAFIAMVNKLKSSYEDLVSSSEAKASEQKYNEIDTNKDGALQEILNFYCTLYVQYKSSSTSRFQNAGPARSTAPSKQSGRDMLAFLQEVESKVPSNVLKDHLKATEAELNELITQASSDNSGSFWTGYLKSVKENDVK